MTTIQPVKLDTDIVTTGKVAKLCGVAARTVNKWCDTGKLKHYRIPGDGGDRRVLISDLHTFLCQYGVSVLAERLFDNEFLVVGIADDEAAQIPIGWQKVTEFNLGSIAATRTIAAAIIGDAWGTSEAVALARSVLEKQPRANVAVVVSEEVGDVPGWGGPVFHRPVDLAFAAQSLIKTSSVFRQSKQVRSTRSGKLPTRIIEGAP